VTHETHPGRAPSSAPLPDAAPLWLFRFTPPSWHPYIQLARLDRPIGWWLLVLPCWWSSALASLAAHRPPHAGHLLLFVIGAIAMRGAGSAYNDVVDRHVDRLVERTRGRPVASGRVGVFAAKVFFVALSFLGLAVALCFNLFTILLGTGSLAIVAIYPFMKRVTSWPQLVLGCAFAWGGLVGWAAAFGSLSAPAYWTYAAAIFWTIGYDTIYAIQDIQDDARAGVRSTARLFGAHVQGAVGALYALSIIFAQAAMLAAHFGPFAQAGVVAFAAHLFWQTRQISESAPPQLALRLFRANRDAGLLLFAGFFVQSLAGAFYS
jgi:4-hydroxybenzoate polyprenyltransferase